MSLALFVLRGERWCSRHLLNFSKVAKNFRGGQGGSIAHDGGMRGDWRRVNSRPCENPSQLGLLGDWCLGSSNPQTFEDERWIQVGPKYTVHCTGDSVVRVGEF